MPMPLSKFVSTNAGRVPVSSTIMFEANIIGLFGELKKCPLDIHTIVYQNNERCVAWYDRQKCIGYISPVRDTVKG